MSTKKTRTATLTFDLSNGSDEHFSFRHAVKADELYFTLQELDEKLRDKVKYADEKDEDAFISGVEWAQEQLNMLCNDSGIVLYE